jgi:hypothetical protein
MLLTFIVLALTLRDLAWLAGDGDMTRGDQCIEEHWSLPSETSLIGMSRTVARNRTAEFEFVRIEARADACSTSRSRAVGRRLTSRGPQRPRAS